MKNMKNNLIDKAAKGCIKIGETGTTTYSIFFNWYEPKLSSKLLKNKTLKEEK